MNRVAHLLLVVCGFSSGVFAQAVVFDYSKPIVAVNPHYDMAVLKVSNSFVPILRSLRRC